MIEFATWIVKLLAIATVGLVCYSICLAVRNKMVSKMILLVTVMVAVSATFQYITPRFNQANNYITRTQQHLDRTKTTVEDVSRYIEKASPITPQEAKPKSKSWLEYLLFGD